MKRPKLNKISLTNLLERAEEAKKNAYAPYSGFKVGAAVLCSSGKVYSGCNIENASLGLTICAERTAIFSAIASGESEIRAIAVVTEHPKLTLPCGACLQVIKEFANENIPVIVSNQKQKRCFTIKSLLPYPFRKELLRNFSKNKKES